MAHENNAPFEEGEEMKFEPPAQENLFEERTVREEETKEEKVSDVKVEETKTEEVEEVEEEKTAVSEQETISSGMPAESLGLDQIVGENLDMFE